MGRLSELHADYEVAKELVSSGRAPLDFLRHDEIIAVSGGRVVIALMQAKSALEDVKTATVHGYQTTANDERQMDEIIRLIDRIRKDGNRGI